MQVGTVHIPKQNHRLFYFSAKEIFKLKCSEGPKKRLQIDFALTAKMRGAMQKSN